MASFEDVHDQPKAGVYGWFARRGETLVCLYIGQAGGRRSVIQKGTLFRGVSQLQRNTFSTDSAHRYRAIDVDFIVGTAIKLFEREGYPCLWQHLDDDPAKEAAYIRQHTPLLQSGMGHIREELRLREEREGYWQLRRLVTRQEREARVVEATDRIEQVLRRLLPAG